MGAHAAMLAAAIRPDLVRRLVMLEGNQGGGTAEEHIALGDCSRSWTVPFARRAGAAAALGDGPLEHEWVDDLEERTDGLRPRFDPNVKQATIEALEALRWEEWESVEVPVLIIYAEGGMFSESEKSDFMRRGRNVQREGLSNASHEASPNAFDQWIDALRRFIAAR